MMKQVLSLQGVEMSSTVLQSILGYLRKFVVLYLPYRPLLSSDFYVIVAITLASTSQENVPFKAAVEVLKLLLDQTFRNGVGTVNVAVTQVSHRVDVRVERAGDGARRLRAAGPRQRQSPGAERHARAALALLRLLRDPRHDDGRTSLVSDSP